MSGLINSAGSRSGVIGTTELDYEEGTYTPVATGSTADPTNASGSTASYEKIGNLVHISGYFSTTYTDGSGSLRMSLPFTCSSLGEGYIPGTIQSYNFNWDEGFDSAAWVIRTAPNQSYATFLASRDATTQLTQTVDTDQAGNIRFSLTYRIA